MRILEFVAMSVSCFLLHNLLENSHYTTCRSNVFNAFFMGETAACRFIANACTVLRLAPLAIAGPLLFRGQNLNDFQ